MAVVQRPALMHDSYYWVCYGAPLCAYPARTLTALFTSTVGAQIDRVLDVFRRYPDFSYRPAYHNARDLREAIRIKFSVGTVFEEVDVNPLLPTGLRRKDPLIISVRKDLLTTLQDFVKRHAVHPQFQERAAPRSVEGQRVFAELHTGTAWENVQVRMCG